MRATFPAGVPAVHHLSARYETKMVGEVFRSIAFTGFSSLVVPISWRCTVARVVDEDLGLTRVRGVREHVGDIKVERLRFTEASAVQQQCDEHAAIVVAPGRAESLTNSSSMRSSGKAGGALVSTFGKRRPRTRDPVSAEDTFAAQVCPRKALLRRYW